MSLKVIFLFSAAVLMLAAGTPVPQYGRIDPHYNDIHRKPHYDPHHNIHHDLHYADAPPSYNFQYAVQDDYYGSDFGHEETRDGYDTKGSYYVLLPDGRRQTVNYYVNGDSGFVAEVSYDGEPHYGHSEYGPHHAAGGVHGPLKGGLYGGPKHHGKGLHGVHGVHGSLPHAHHGSGLHGKGYHAPTYHGTGFNALTHDTGYGTPKRHGIGLKSPIYGAKTYDRGLHGNEYLEPIYRH